MSYSLNDKRFLSLIIFGPLISAYLAFSLDPLSSSKLWGRSRKLGPICHPLWTIKFSFLGFCWLLISGYLATWIFLWVPYVSLHVDEMCHISDILYGSKRCTGSQRVYLYFADFNTNSIALRSSSW
jgi:hypothetical protein